MNYAAHYRKLIERARARELIGYVERHHIKPKCLGGSDQSRNIAILTAEEHYVAHQLLVKMYPGNVSLLWAAMNMTGKGNRHYGRRNKLYGWLRRRLSTRLTGRKMSDEARQKMRANACRRGRVSGPHLESTKRLMSLASKGVPKSAEHRAALSAAKLGKKTGPQSLKHRRNIAKALHNSEALRIAVKCAHADPVYRALQSKRMKQVWRRRASGALPMPIHNRR